MGTAGLGLVLGGSFVVGCGCLPWWCRLFVPWCVLACGAACVPYLACVWRALLARACCCAGAGTHPLSGGPVWLHGGPCWCPAVAWRAAVGCVHVGGGGGVRTLPLVFPALSLCPSSPACPACPPSSYPLGWPWPVGWSWRSDMVFLSCRAAWAGFVLGAGCSCGVLRRWAPVHRCARSVCGVVCTVSWAPRLLFTGVHALRVVSRVRRPGPPGSCSPVCTPCVWCRLYGVLGLPAPVHRCARSVCGVAYTVSWASRLLFTGVHALCVVLRVRCPGPPGSCSLVRTLCVWRCVYDVLGLPAPVHRCARSACGVACTASWASRLLFTGVHALCVVLRVRCPGLPGSCSPVRTPCVWCRVYGVLGLPAPVHRCTRPACGVACTASWASRLLFTGVHALCVVSRVRRPGPPGSCSPVCTFCVWGCVYGVLGLPAPVHRCARSACGVACTVSWAPRLLFTGAHALRVVLCVRRPGPPGSCSPVRTLCVWCCVYGVLGLLAPVHRCARSVCGVACTVSWASRLLFTGVHALCVVLRVRCPGLPGSCSPVRTPCVWCCAYGVLGLPAPVHRCVRSVCGVACTASWASRLLFTGVNALCVRCPGPPGSCSPVCTLCVWCCVYGVLGLPAPVHRCARSACGAVCTMSWASRLLFTGAHALRVVLRVRCPGPPGSCSPVCTLCVCVRCPGPPGSCSPVCTLSVWWCVYGVRGLPAPVHRCARSVCGGACAVSWAFWLVFTGVHALCLVLCVRCPGPPGSCSPVRTPCAWCCVCRLALLRSCGACCVVRVVSWDTWFAVSGVAVCCGVCVVSGVRCCVCGVLGLPAPVHRCACSVCCVVCAVWVWLRACVCHTVAASSRTLRFCGNIFLYTCSLWRLIYSSRFGLFDFGDAQE